MSTDLYQRFKERNVVEKLIVLNILVFILTYLLNTASFLFNYDGNMLVDWFALRPSFEQLLYRPWTLITYGFLHVGFFHILFNLLILYYFGSLFLDFFRSGQFLTYFFTWGCVWGTHLHVGLQLSSCPENPGYDPGRSLCRGYGYCCRNRHHIPNYALHFRFLGSIKLMYIAIVMVVLDVVQIPAGNAGGHLAHLGGALLGFLLTRYLNQGKGIAEFWKSQWPIRKETPLKTVYRSDSSVKKRSSSRIRSEENRCHTRQDQQIRL